MNADEDTSKFTIKEQKDAGGEVTYDVPNFDISNVFECVRNNTDVSYERVYMDISGNEYFTGVFDHLKEYHDRHGQILSSKKLEKDVLRIMEEEEEEIERNINNITCNTSFQSPKAMNAQKKDANLSLERRLASGVLAEMVEIFKRCTIKSDEHVDEINDSEEHHDVRSWLRIDSAKHVDAISDSKIFFVDGRDPKRDPVVATHTTNRMLATHTTNRISTQNALINPTIQVVVRPITLLVTACVVGVR